MNTFEKVALSIIFIVIILIAGFMLRDKTIQEEPPETLPEPVIVYSEEGKITSGQIIEVNTTLGVTVT